MGKKRRDSILRRPDAAGAESGNGTGKGVKIVTLGDGDKENQVSRVPC